MCSHKQSMLLIDDILANSVFFFGGEGAGSLARVLSLSPTGMIG